ncbi:MAG: helix-turn-helix transcriptional regulator [Pseudomonadota bacterium]
MMLAQNMPTPNSNSRLVLTKRETQCLQALADGLDNAGIAKTLGIRVPTVAMHIANARRKLGALTRIQAVAKAVGTGLIHP